MGEVVNVLVAFAVIVFIFRWATSSNDSPEQRNATSALGFRPKNVTQDMVNTISNMFPDIPAENIHYDLLRTGSVEQTTNKILERGFLPAPPQAYHTIYPRNATTPTTNTANTGNTQNTNARPVTNANANINVITLPKKPTTTLISRYHLENQAQAQSTGGAGVSSPATDNGVDDPFKAGGKAVWEDTPEKREESLRQRKAQMVLAARQRLLSQQQKAKEAAGSSNAASSSSS